MVSAKVASSPFKLDRITRSTRDLADLLALFAKHDAALVSVSEHLDTQTASGRIVVSMLGVVKIELVAHAEMHQRRGARNRRTTERRPVIGRQKSVCGAYSVR